MLQVRNPVLSESLTLIVDKRADSASQRHDGHSRGRLKTRNQPEQVGNQNEKCKGHQKGRISITVVPDDFVALSLDKTMDAFKDMLQSARIVHRKPRAHQSESRNQK